MFTTEYLEKCITYARGLYSRAGHRGDVYIIIAGTNDSNVRYHVVHGNPKTEDWRVLWSAELDAIRGDGLIPYINI